MQFEKKDRGAGCQERAVHRARDPEDNRECGESDIWKACRISPYLEVINLDQRYLRLDRHVDGLARLSPSILREFFTYSVIGLGSDQTRLAQRGEEVLTRIREISRFKLDLAREMTADVVRELEARVAVPH